MTQREINRAIYLSGIKSAGRGYVVHHDIPGESIVCEVPSVSVGNAIVRALRERATIQQDKARQRQAGIMAEYVRRGADIRAKVWGENKNQPFGGI